MKKTLSRTLSLLLVLAMVLTFVPMSLAVQGDDASVTVSSSSDTVVLKDKKASATFEAKSLAPDNYRIKSYDWYINPTGATGSKSAGDTVYTVNFQSAGTYTVGVHVVYEVALEDGTTTEVTKDGSARIAVEEEASTLTSVMLGGDDEVQVGKTIDLTYVTVPLNYEAKNEAWACEPESVATVDQNGKVTGKKEGTAVVSVTVDGKSDTKKINVIAAETTVTVPEEITVAVGKTADIEVTFDPEEAEEDATITYTSAKSSIASVSSKGVVTGEKVGSTKIYVKVTNVDDFEDTTFTVPVTVTKEALTCDYKTASAAKSGTETAKLEPEYSGSGKGVTYTFTKKSSFGSISVDEKTGMVTATGVAAIYVEVKAWDEDNKLLGSCYSGASFYEYNDVSVTMPDGNTTLTFGEPDDIEEKGNLYTKLTDDYTGSSTDRFYVTGLDTAEGTLTGTGWSSVNGYTTVGSVGKLKFTVGTKGSASFDYEMVFSGHSELPLRKGEVEIDYDGEVGRIEFSGTYDSSLTLGEANFEKFWKACKMSGSLDYVQLNTLPSSTYGTFYTSKTNKTSSYAAKTSHKFYDEYTSADAKNNSNAQDLDLLTFVPVSTKKDTYDVVVSFTAYGVKDEQVTGNIVIHMNETTNDITSRGIFFGTQYDTKNKLTYADKIADAFEEATDEDLGYVIFTLPAAEQAHLYLEIPSSSSGNTLVAQGEHLSSKTKLYYDTDNKKVDWLEDAALIPAAGYSGKITLSYTAYTEDGETSKEGTITFNVTSKTKSAVFSDVGTSYSWAADSVDFLYYEGTAQGANGKYNPTNNITRGDFMLMLYRAFLEDDYSTYTVTSNFSDVVKGTSDYSKETYQAVGVAKYLGIAQGSNNKYNPTNSITREEAMTLIQRTLDKVGRTLDYTTSTKASSFSDYSSISAYAKTSIDTLVKNGVIVGNNNKINPKSYITRAEMACILHRVITY